MAFDERLFPWCDSDAELEFVEHEHAFEEWQLATKEHPGGKCPPSVEGGHCMVCQHLTGDPFYVWRRLIIINRQQADPTGPGIVMNHEWLDKIADEAKARLAARGMDE